MKEIGEKHVNSMLVQCIELEPYETLQFAYDFYMRFYNLTREEVKSIHIALVKYRLVHSIVPYNNMQHKMKSMSALEALNKI